VRQFTRIVSQVWVRRSMGVLVLLMAPPFALYDREAVFSEPATAGTNDATPLSFRVSVRPMGFSLRAG